MSDLRNVNPIEVGDLVKCTFLGSPEFRKVGLVINRIHYVEPDPPYKGSHPDEYSCEVMFDHGSKMVRAKWLKPVSKK